MRATHRCSSLALVIGSVLASSAALAQQSSAGLEELVVTGTRKTGQSATETLSPVDLLGGELLTSQANFDLTDGLPKVSPSLNTQRFPIADGTAFIRPVTLRNLAPDQTLVLMNGTRRHRSALVNLQLAPLGTVNQGSQGVDFAAFPAAAIERVEILRDGASAQYGSDAIAGVVNIILKNAPEGGSASVQWGEYYESDGDRLSVSGNVGLPLTSARDSSTSPASTRPPRSPGAATRARTRWRSARSSATDLVPLDGLGQRWGDPDVEALKFSLNAGVDLTEHLEAYGFATYMDNTTTSDFFYRGAGASPRCSRPDSSARTTLQIDSDGDGLPDSGAAVAGRQHRRTGAESRATTSCRARRAPAATCCATRSTPSSRAATTRTSVPT